MIFLGIKDMSEVTTVKILITHKEVISVLKYPNLGYFKTEMTSLCAMRILTVVPSVIQKREIGGCASLMHQ